MHNLFKIGKITQFELPFVLVQKLRNWLLKAVHVKFITCAENAVLAASYYRAKVKMHMA